MQKASSYITHNLYYIFLSMFIPLFGIASMIFIIKLAAYTAVIQLDFLDMAKLYLFTVPDILFYTLPITFFIAAALTLFRLSSDSEMIVFFSLGISPSFILKTLFKPAISLSLILLFNYLIIFPHTKVLYRNFVNYKKSEAKFNLSASEFGHSFGEWLLYIGESKEDGEYSDVYLFNKSEDKEILISAKTAQIINDEGILRLKLTDGNGFTYSKEKFSQMDFNTMFINDTLNAKLITYRNAYGYWTDSNRKKMKKKMLITNTLLSLFPILSLFIVASIGIVHARHQKSKIYIYIFISIIIFYASAIGLQKVLSFYTIPVVVGAWLSATYLIYRKTTASRF